MTLSGLTAGGCPQQVQATGLLTCRLLYCLRSDCKEFTSPGSGVQGAGGPPL